MSKETGAWLVGGGEMAKLITSKDWSTTALGPLESWPQSLRTVVSLMQASNSPISLAWGPGHVQIYNDGYWPICGDKHPTSMGQDFRECWAAPWPVIHEAYESAWAGKTSYLEKMRMFLERYGFLEETWFTFSFSPITDESGGIGGVFHPVTEMTRQMLSERRTQTLRDLAVRAGKARTSEQACALLVEVLSAATLDIPFALIHLTDAAKGGGPLAAETGLPEGTATALPIDEVLRGDEARSVDLAPILRGLVAGPYPEPPRVALALPIRQPGSDAPAGVLVCGISARLELDQAYRHFVEMVAAAIATALANARAYEEERKRAEALAEIDRAKTAFFSNVSHEFRTPLTLILGPLEDALAAEPRRLEGENLERAHRSAVRLLRLVNSLLDFARLESRRAPLRFVRTDLAAMTADLASSFRSLIERAGLRFDVDCPPAPEPTYVDPAAWEKIVLNLVSNAFKFTLAGEIAVALRSHGDHVVLQVRDTGCGIPEREVPHVLERFHTVEGAKGRSFEGSGIGLALVDELARLHGGTVRVSSVEGEGSTFEVAVPTGTQHLPADRIAERATTPTDGTAPYLLEAAQWHAQPERDRLAAAPDASLVRAVGTEGPSSQSSRARVLVADDNADMREYLARLLSTRWRVELVVDGEAALASARNDPPDLVLSDVMMPRLDGVALLRALRADPRTSRIPIILLSARAGEEAVLEGLETGADDYLVKPFAARELLARVHTHIELARLRHAWLGELERSNQELEAFSYSVSHDLRAPLRAIDGFSRALLMHAGSELDDKGRHYLSRVRSATERMSRLIDDLLSLSTIGRAALRRDEVDLSAMARQILAELSAREPERKVEIVVESGLAAVGDGRLLEVVLDNLLGNAWKFTARRTAARIEVGRVASDPRAPFFVRDNGAGFDMRYAKNIFAPFQRFHSDADFEGTGIGLATVRRIVVRHGGIVWAEARPDEGATIFFTLRAANGGLS